MPKSRRDKKVDLTKVTKKPERKSEYREKIGQLFPVYKFLYVIKFQNSRNAHIGNIRRDLTDSSTVFGKSKGDEVTENFHQLAKFLKGQVALVFSNHQLEFLRNFFNEYRSLEFSRSGNLATQTVTVAAGLLQRLPHTMEPVLRSLNMPVKLEKGIIRLESDFKICEKDTVLTPDQCKILKIFDVQMAEFQIEIVAFMDVKSKKVKNVHEKDGYNMVTNLYPEIIIKSQKLDDGKWYFIPENVEEIVKME